MRELEYEMAEEEGRKEIGLHIPTDVRMEAGRLNASLEAAGTFIRRYLSEVRRVEPERKNAERG